MTKSHWPNHTQKLGLRLAVFAMLVNCPWVFAADSQIDPTLEKLEQKFFSQTYKSDTDDKRLGRLEEMLFGHTVAGPIEQRFASIQSALNSIKKDSPVSQELSPADDTGSGSGLETSEKGKPVVGKAPAADSKSYQPLDASGYQPQAADDANALVGISPEQAARVRRRKAALMGASNGYGADGQMSAQDDGQDEALTDSRQVAGKGKGGRKHSDWDDSEGMSGADSMTDADDSDQDMISIGMGLGNAMSSAMGSGLGGMSMGGMGSNMGMGGSSNFFGQRGASKPPKYAPATQQQQPRTGELNMTEKLSVMEKKVFGKANPRQPLLERVKRLEKDVLPTEKDAAQEALPDRVAKLWVAVGSKPVQTGGIQYPATADDQTGKADSYPTSQPYAGNSTMSLGGSGSSYPQNMDVSNKPGVLHKIGQAIGQAASGMMSGNNNYGYPGYGYGGMSPYGMSPYGMSPYGMSPYGMSPYGMSPYGGLGGSYRNLPFIGGGGMSPFGGGFNPYGYGGINPYGYGGGISPFGVSPLGNQIVGPAAPSPLRPGGFNRFF